MTLNKAQLVSDIQETVDDMTKADAERIMQTFIDSITDALVDGEKVSIAGFGIFETRIRKARTARNPRTGEPIEVPEMRVPKFRAAKALKEAVKGE